MAILGNRDTRDNVVLTGIDAALLENYRLNDGTTYAQVVAMAEGAIGAFNAGLASDPFYSQLVSFTDRIEYKYEVGNTSTMTAHTEYGRPDPNRAERAGHMLPLRKWDHALGWTADYLDEARMDDVAADINMALEAAQNRWRVGLLGRILKRGDESGAANGLSTTGLSPGFATTAASTGVDFIPPSYGGTTFANTHEHYNTGTGGAMTDAMLLAARDDLREHGHEPPYEFIVGATEETAIAALTTFIPVNEALVQNSIINSQATFTGQSIMGKRPIGAIHGMRIWVVPGMPQYYGFGWKAYGSNSMRNPLRVRVPEGFGLPRLVAMRDHNNPGIYAIQNLMTQIAFGVGVGDRTNGVAVYNNNATWADGTAS